MESASKNKNLVIRNSTAEQPKNDITPKQLAFGVFCIENIAEYLSLRGDEVYFLLTEKSDILDNYIFTYYDVLHTQGCEYIVREITELMKAKGIIQ